MLLEDNFANRTWHRKLKSVWNPDKWVLIWECFVRAIQWIPTWQGLDSFQNSLHPCSLDKSSLSIRRVNYTDLDNRLIRLSPLTRTPSRIAGWVTGHWRICLGWSLDSWPHRTSPRELYRSKSRTSYCSGKHQIDYQRVPEYHGVSHLKGWKKIIVVKKVSFYYWTLERE